MGKNLDSIHEGWCIGKKSFLSMYIAWQKWIFAHSYLLFFIFVGRNSNTTPNVLVEAPSMNLWSRFLLMHKNIDRAFANVILKICCYSFCIGRDKNSCSDIKSFCTIIFNFCSNLFHKIYTMFH